MSKLRKQDYFGINNISGEINLIHPLDYEQEQRYILQIAAKDAGIPPQTGYEQLCIFANFKHMQV